MKASQNIELLQLDHKVFVFVLNIRVFQKKVASPQLFVIFALRLSLFRMKFCKFVGNSYPHISANFCTFILSNGINYFMSTGTYRFHRVKFWVLNADASWARTWWESHHCQLYPDKGWKLSTVKKVCSRVVNQAVGLGDLPRRLHVQFVVLRQFPIGRPY